MTYIDRRRLLAAAAALPAAACATQPKPAPTAAWTPDGTEMAARIRSGEMTALEAVEDAIRKCEALQPKLHFVVNSSYDRALDQARRGGQTGPFAGVPFFVKDLDDATGLPTRKGSRWTLRDPPKTEQDVYIDAFDKAGFIILGKSATPEEGFLPTTEPLVFDATRNPWNPDYSAGGSSGGAAAATAAGVIPIGHASDGGGSIRIPASNCGLFGLKPSRGRMVEKIPSRKVIDLGVHHAVTHSVRDSAALFALTEDTGPERLHKPIGFVRGPSRRRLRVGLVFESANGREPDAEVRAAVEGAASLLTGLGHKVTPTKWPIEGKRFSDDFLTLWASGAAMLFEDVVKAWGRAPDESLLEPFTLQMAQMVAKLPGGAIDQAIAGLEAASKAYDGWFEDLDVVVSPVLGKPPVPLGYVRADVPFETLRERLTDYVGYTPVHNVAGAPAMSVPLHWTADGLPVGVMFAARAGDERTLFQLAYELERAQPWAQRRPPISA